MHHRKIEEDRVSLFDCLRYDCPPGVHPRLHVCTLVLQRSSTIYQKEHYQVSRHNLTYIPYKCISSIYVTTCFIYQTVVLICVRWFLLQWVFALCWNPVLWVRCVLATCNMFLAVFCPVITVVSPTGLFQLRGVYCSRCTAAPVNSLLQGKELRIRRASLSLFHSSFQWRWSYSISVGKYLVNMTCDISLSGSSGWQWWRPSDRAGEWQFNQITCLASHESCLNCSCSSMMATWMTLVCFIDLIGPFLLLFTSLKPPVPVFIWVVERWPSPLTFCWSLSMYILRSTCLRSPNSCQHSRSPQLTCCYGDRHNCPHGLSAGYQYNMPMGWPGTALLPHDSSPWCNCLDNSGVFTWSSNITK